MILLGALLLPAGQAAASASLADTMMTNGNLFGEALSELGDINGDGRWELLVGQPGFSAGSSHGRVCLWYGGTDLTAAPDVVWNGRLSGSQFGWSVAAVGDVNDDGDPDWVVGAPLYNAGGLERGQVYIFYGGGNPAFALADSILGEVGGDWFGFSVSAAGDFDHDGVDDFVVGAPRWSAQRGAAYVIYGRAGGVSTNLADATRLEGEVGGDLFGWSVTDAGNFFGGSFRDCVAVGAPSNDNNFGLDAGAAYVFQGGLLPDAAFDLLVGIGGTAANSQYGFAVEGVGRWNTDSFDDLAIGGPFNSNAAAQAGQVEIVYGGLAPSNTGDRYVRGERSGDNFGWSLAGVGDVLGSGADDVLIGAPFHNKTGTGGGSDTGRAYLYAGGSSATGAAALTILDNQAIQPGTEPDDQFGYGVSWAGDFDGDGASDYAVGAPGGNTRNGSTAGFAVLFDSSDLVVPAFLKAWKARWTAPDEPGLVRLEFAFADHAVTYRHVEIERTVRAGDGAGYAERLWSGPPTLAGPGEPGVLGLDGAGFRFLDPGPATPLTGTEKLSYRITILDEAGQSYTQAALAGPAGAPAAGFDVVLALDPAWPNPANPAVTVRFRASPRETVHLRILDVRGRLVRELYRGPGTGDWQHEVWNGRASGGVAAASGLYLIQLEDGRKSLTRRVVLAR
jgi:hypothetical protein